VDVVTDKLTAETSCKVGRLGHERMMACEYPPGIQAPSAGTYEQQNVLGTPTGVRVTVSQGEVLPAAPRGFTWRMVEPNTNHRTD
jgi:hypothetical protein